MNYNSLIKSPQTSRDVCISEIFRNRTYNAPIAFQNFRKKIVTQGLTLTTENCFKKASLKFQQFKEENGHEIQSYKIIYSFTMINDQSYKIIYNFTIESNFIFKTFHIFLLSLTLTVRPYHRKAIFSNITIF